MMVLSHLGSQGEQVYLEFEDDTTRNLEVYGHTDDLWRTKFGSLAT